MTPRRPLLSGISYSLGEVHSLDMLRETEGVGAEVLTSLRARGLAHFCDDPRDAHHLCMESVVETLRKTGRAAASIDAIVVANSYAEWSLPEETALLSALHAAGFLRVPIVGVNFQGCSAGNTALKIAGGLVAPPSDTKHVLVVVFGKRKKTTSRLTPDANILFSDGAVSCLVSSEGGTFEMLAARTMTNTGLAATQWGPGNFLKCFQAGTEEIRAITRDVYRDAGITANDVRMLFGTNGSSVYLNVIGAMAGIPMSRVYQADMAKFGHLHACDNLIGLENFGREHPPVAGEHYLLVSWTPHVFGASVLRCAA
jgi:3-oxoacyl-[acyl-carrier-protein] synthase-3